MKASKKTRLGLGGRWTWAVRAAARRKNRPNKKRPMFRASALAAMAVLLGTSMAQAQYAPWPYYGGFNWYGNYGGYGYSSTPAEGFLSGWARATRALAEANYLNALATSEYQRSVTLGLNNRGIFLSPYTPPEGRSGSTGYKITESYSAQPLETPPAEPQARAAASKKPVYLSWAVGQRAAEAEARQTAYAGARKDRAERQMNAYLEAQSLVPQIESTGGKLDWPKALRKSEYRENLDSISICLGRWAQSYSLSGVYRTQLKRSLTTLETQLAKQQRQQATSELAEARDLLRKIDTLVFTKQATAVKLASNEPRTR